MIERPPVRPGAPEQAASLRIRPHDDTMRFRLPAPQRFSFQRTVLSHGWAFLPPFALDTSRRVLHRVLVLPARSGRGPVVLVRLREAPGGVLVETGDAARGRHADLRKHVSRILGLTEDLAPFYARVGTDPGFAWIAECGAGRLLRAPTVFEDLVKMICTTNCSWALTEQMVGRLVDRLGRPVSRDGLPASAPVARGRARLSAAGPEKGFMIRPEAESPLPAKAFPDPRAMAAQPERFYREEIRAGYRARALVELAGRVAAGELDVEGWRESPESTADLKRALLGVRGVGPYAAENVLKLLGQHDGLALDSWCRSTFSRRHRAGRRASDRTISRYYARFDEWRGLALWCDLTKHWIDGTASEAGEEGS